jgi:hypothetical protein
MAVKVVSRMATQQNGRQDDSSESGPERGHGRIFGDQGLRREADESNRDRTEMGQLVRAGLGGDGKIPELQSRAGPSQSREKGGEKEKGEAVKEYLILAGLIVVMILLAILNYVLLVARCCGWKSEDQQPDEGESNSRSGW